MFSHLSQKAGEHELFADQSAVYPPTKICRCPRREVCASQRAAASERTAHRICCGGSGKTGIDACLWLLENNVSSDAITWIMPRDAWYLNRANVQPGEEFFTQSFAAFAQEIEAVAAATSIEDLFVKLAASIVLLRLDDAVTPNMFHSAIMSESEMVELQRIKNIVRLGRLQRIELNQMVLDRGMFATDPNRLYVDCSASAVARRPIVPVFSGDTITPQFVRTVQPTFSAAHPAHVEAHNDDEAEKHKLGTVIPLPDEPVDWLKMLTVNMGDQQRGEKDKDLRTWTGWSTPSKSGPSTRCAACRETVPGAI